VQLQDFIDRALAEDIGSGDHTSKACLPDDVDATAHLIAKDKGIIAGVELAEQILKTVDPDGNFKVSIVDGQKISDGTIVFVIKSTARSILRIERLVLNCMQRMSGIATYTNEITKQLKGLSTKILDTRKTTPTVRFLEKWAVKIGGGDNHRFGLYDMVMIKDNHIDYVGGIATAIDRTVDYLKTHNLPLKIEIETRNTGEVNQVIEHGQVDRIMFDNFTVEETQEAVALIDGRFETESSGKITIENVRQYAETGVDYISIGALTHSFRSLDLSLKAVI